jgi:hypothetical protein
MSAGLGRTPGARLIGEHCDIELFIAETLCAGAQDNQNGTWALKIASAIKRWRTGAALSQSRGRFRGGRSSEAAVGFQLKNPGVAVDPVTRSMSMWPRPGRPVPVGPVPIFIFFGATPSLTSLLIPYALIVIILDGQTQRQVWAGSHICRSESGDQES